MSPSGNAQDTARSEDEHAHAASRAEKAGTIAALIAFPVVFGGCCGGGLLAFGSLAAGLGAAGAWVAGGGALVLLLGGIAAAMLVRARRQRGTCDIEPVPAPGNHPNTEQNT